MNDFVAHISLRVKEAIVALSLGLVAFGIWQAGLLGPAPISSRMGPIMTQFWGWCSILIGGIITVNCAKWWVNGEFLRINNSGIHWYGEAIPWDQIALVTEAQVKDAKLIIVHLHDPSSFPSKKLSRLAARTKRGPTGGDLAISLSITNRKFHEAMSAIAMFKPYSNVR